MSDLADKLSKAIENRNNNLNNWTWKDKTGTEVKLVDLDVEQLQKAYTHVLDMLYRKSDYKFGKYEVRKNIDKIYTSCNSELFLRYILHEAPVQLFTTNAEVLNAINSFKESSGITNDSNVCEMFNSVPKEFESLTIGDLLNACLDCLEPINRRLISDDFIMSIGVWLTEPEKKELTEFENGKLRPWLDVMKERLFINDNYFRVTPTGLSYTELRLLLNLESRAKVSSTPSATLKLLRDKVLLLLNNDLEYHIKKWTDLKSKIESVATYKGWGLKNKYENKR